MLIYQPQLDIGHPGTYSVSVWHSLEYPSLVELQKTSYHSSLLGKLCTDEEKHHGYYALG
jgi:hypothetical protein